MSLRAIAAVSLLLLVSERLDGDVVTLKDGKTLRGLDLREVRVAGYGKLQVFTLETGEDRVLAPESIASVEKSRPNEKIEFRGREVTLRQKIQILQREAKDREREAVRAVERWARGRAGSEAARETFEALSAGDQQRVLAATLVKSYRPEARLLAAQELARHEGDLAAAALSNAAIADKSEEIRETSLQSLAVVSDGEPGRHLVRFLGSPSPEVRMRAARAIEMYPTRQAVPGLLWALRRVYDDFGRASFFVGTQRAYISDYDLVSGGTGFSIVEVATPQVETVSTGVVLDAKVERVEITTYVAALKRATGQDFGADVARWHRWWLAHKDDKPETGASTGEPPAGEAPPARG